MTPELKACPFCGSTHTYSLALVHVPGAVAACGNCYARIEIATSEEDAIAAWNTRVKQEQSDA